MDQIRTFTRNSSSKVAIRFMDEAWVFFHLTACGPDFFFIIFEASCQLVIDEFYFPLWRVE